MLINLKTMYICGVVPIPETPQLKVILEAVKTSQTENSAFFWLYRHKFPPVGTNY